MKHYLLTWYGITDFHAEFGFDLQKVMTDGKGYQIATLCKQLELLLALLRSCGDEHEKFKTILAPEKKLTKRYVTLVPKAHSYRQHLVGIVMACAPLIAVLSCGARKDLSISAKLKNA